MIAIINREGPDEEEEESLCPQCKKNPRSEDGPLCLACRTENLYNPKEDHLWE